MPLNKHFYAPFLISFSLCFWPFEFEAKFIPMGFIVSLVAEQ